MAANTRPDPDSQAEKVTRFGFGCLAVALGLGLFAAWLLRFAVAEVMEQHRALTRFLPVEGTVISSRSGPRPDLAKPGSVKATEWIVGESHEVWVSYRYQVEGKEYASGRADDKDFHGPFAGVGRVKKLFGLGDWTGQVGPPRSKESLWGGRAIGRAPWARSIADRYVPGKPCQVWYDPDDPSRSYLLREADFAPYLLILMLLPFVCLLVAIAVFPLLLLVQFAFWLAGRYDPEPNWPMLVWLGLVGTYFVGGGLALGDYFAFAESPFGRDSQPIFGLLLYVVPPAALWHIGIRPQWTTGDPGTKREEPNWEEARQRRVRKLNARKGKRG